MPITGLQASLFLYALIVLALLVAELREDRRAQYIFKPLAAFGFILLALQSGALGSLYGCCILAALLVCAAGDVCLLSRDSKGMFVLGMAAFMLGHLLFGGAFATLGTPVFIKYIVWIAPLIVMGVSWAATARLDKLMRWAVMVYAIIILTMVMWATGSKAIEKTFLIPLAAIMFAVSDIFVGSDRFIKPSPKNFLAITPLYFGAQALFALSVSI